MLGLTACLIAPTAVYLYKRSEKNLEKTQASYPWVKFYLGMIKNVYWTMLLALAFMFLFSLPGSTRRWHGLYRCMLD